jgi:cellulose synthase (UDP-forming)
VYPSHGADSLADTITLPAVPFHGSAIETVSPSRVAVAAPTRRRDRRDTNPLPACPTDAETHLYSRRRYYPVAAFSAISFALLAASQSRFILTADWAWALAPFFTFTTAYFLLAGWVNLGTRDFNRDAHDELVHQHTHTPAPSLDVFLPVCREPAAVLHNTWTGVFELMEAYRGRCNVYVLDDGADPECARMAGDFGFTYLARPEKGYATNYRGWYKKAGNLRHGFAHSDGEFILVLDADFNPRADLPDHLLPYLIDDPQLGIVQSPQFFRTHRGQTRMERGASAVQELFYRTVQVSRDQRGGAICVGSCAIYRREALEANGGATLIGHSEDVHTGFDLRRQGWGLRYLPVPLATGVCPDNPDSFFAQQYRWCMGSMALLCHRRFWKHRMPLRTRACYVSGFCYYVHTAVSTLVTPVIPLVMLLAIPGHVRLVNYAYIAPSMLYNLLIFPLWHRCRFGPSAYMAKLLYGWAHLFALIDLLRRRPMGWKPTGAAGAARRNGRLWAGMWGWSVSTGLAWTGIAAWRTTTEGMRFAPITLLGALTLWITLLAIASRKGEAR